MTQSTKPTFLEAVQSKVNSYREQTGLPYENREHLELAENALHQMLTGRSKSGTGLSMKEALMSRDFPLLLNKVINEKILMPIEPDYIGQALLANTIMVGKTTGLYNIPAFGWLNAAEVGEAAEYPEGTAEFQRNSTSVMIRKYGIRVGVTAEMMDVDELGLFGLHVQAAKLAMNRKKEEVIFSLFRTNTMAAFDNATGFGTVGGQPMISTIVPGTTWQSYFSAGSQTVLDPAKVSGVDTEYQTTGLDKQGYLNGTVHMFDIVQTMAALVADGYEPTEMLVHPIAWAVFAQNPMFNGFQYYSTASQTANVMNSPQIQATGPQDWATIRMPWAMTMHISPFVNINYQIAQQGLPLLTDIYLGSRRNGVLLLQGQPLMQDAYSDLAREIYNVRLREYYGVGLADMGRSWRSIKNVRVAASYDYSLVRTVPGS